MKFKGNRKRHGGDTEKVLPVFPWETTSGKAVVQISCNNKASWNRTQNRRMSSIRSLSILRHAFLSETVNMVAAMNWCSHTTHNWIWWLFVPLRQYFRLYRTVFQRGRKKRKKIDERKNVQTTFTRTYCKSALGPFPTIIQISRAPRH